MEWWNYDVWGNARDGYEVNDRSASGETVVIYENDDDKTILARMRDAGLIGKGVKTSGIEIDGELPWNLYFTSAKGKPLGELTASPSYRRDVPDTDKDGWDRVRLPMVKNPSRRYYVVQSASSEDGPWHTVSDPMTSAAAQKAVVSVRKRAKRADVPAHFRVVDEFTAHKEKVTAARKVANPARRRR